MKKLIRKRRQELVPEGDRHRASQYNHTVATSSSRRSEFRRVVVVAAAVIVVQLVVIAFVIKEIRMKTSAPQHIPSFKGNKSWL